MIDSFNLSLSEIDAEYGNALHDTEIRWLSRETMLKRVLALRLEKEMFMNEKGKVVGKLSDEKWLMCLVLQCDISHHLK
jgi:hypothetical protein